MRVQHNINAMNANRNLGISNSQLAKSSEKLSSGYRINRAGDDAAGLYISEKLRNQVRGLNKASKNAQDGISLIQTAEGALNETHSILQRMSELAVQSANDTNQTMDRAAAKKEIDALISEIDRIATTTQFNKMDLLKGDFTGKKLQVGANASQNIGININSCKASALGISTTTLKVSSYDNASSAITTIQNAINTISERRADMGAVQNRLEHTISNLDVAAENAQASESRIRDVDMASEMVEYSKHNILLQAGQSMLAQANQSTQGVLSLF